MSKIIVQNRLLISLVNCNAELSYGDLHIFTSYAHDLALDNVRGELGLHCRRHFCHGVHIKKLTVEVNGFDFGAFQSKAKFLVKRYC